MFGLTIHATALKLILLVRFAILGLGCRIDGKTIQKGPNVAVETEAIGYLARQYALETEDFPEKRLSCRLCFFRETRGRGAGPGRIRQDQRVLLEQVQIGIQDRICRL